MSKQLSFAFETGSQPLLQLWTPDEIYDRLDGENIAEFQEDRRIERKSAKIEGKILGDYMSMWSNTHPHGGLMLIGVEDNGSISGCAGLSTGQRNKLDSMSVYCPDAHWTSKPLKVKNSAGKDDYILVYRVKYRDDKLVETVSGDAFFREGDRKVKLNETLKREVRIAKHEIHYELEPVSLKFPGDFDGVLIGRFCRSFVNNRRFRDEKTATEILCLAKLGKLVGGEFKPNLACALLFAIDPRDIVPGARIRIIKYDGTTEKFGHELNSVFSTFVDGCVPRLLDEAKRVIQDQIRVSQRLKNGRLVSTPEYPEDAWFEAIVNAVAHRSYNYRTQNIFVKLFDDRLVVESPGGFVPPTTGETVYNTHNPRNPFLMEAMMQFDLTFCGFEGTRRMRQAMDRAGLPAPKFVQKEIDGQQVHVSLANNFEDQRVFDGSDASSYLTENAFKALTADERQIVLYLGDKSTINITSAAILTKKSWPTANKMFLKLIDDGIIEVVNGRGKKHDSTKLYQLRRQQKD